MKNVAKTAFFGIALIANAATLSAAYDDSSSWSGYYQDGSEQEIAYQGQQGGYYQQGGMYDQNPQMGYYQQGGMYDQNPQMGYSQQGGMYDQNPHMGYSQQGGGYYQNSQMGYQQDGYYQGHQGGYSQQSYSQPQYQSGGCPSCGCASGGCPASRGQQSYNAPSQMQSQPMQPSANMNMNFNSNEALASKVRSALQNSSMSANARNAQVTADNGIIILTGAVDNDDEKKQAELLVLKISGVRSVKNNLTPAK